MTKTRVTVVHNLPAPYRLPIFEKLLDDPELDVRIFFTGKPRSNRPFWSADFRVQDPRIVYLPEVAFPLRGKSADKININFSIGQIFSLRPDVLLLDGYQDPTNLIVAVICWIKKIPYILSAEISYVWTSTLTARLFSRVVGQVVRRAAYLTPSSNSCAAFFQHLGGNSSRMRVIPLLPDVQRLASVSSSKRGRHEEIRAKYGLDKKFVVLYVGRFEDYKGIRELFVAMDQVVSQDPNVCFVFIGNGSLENEVREKCELSPDSSLYAGSVDDDKLLDLLSIADIHVMPSWHEAYGVVAAEALSCGVPSIVTKYSGCRDLVIDGMNGFVIEPKDPGAITRSILALSSNPALAERMKRSAAVSMNGLSIESLYASLKMSILLAKPSGKH